MAPEAKVLAAIRRLLDQMIQDGQPLWYVKIVGGPRQNRALPDLHISINGRSIWLEVKAPGKEPTLLQASVLKKIGRGAAVATVVRSVDEVREILTRHFSERGAA